MKVFRTSISGNGPNSQSRHLMPKTVFISHQAGSPPLILALHPVRAWTPPIPRQRTFFRGARSVPPTLSALHWAGHVAGGAIRSMASRGSGRSDAPRGRCGQTPPRTGQAGAQLTPPQPPGRSLEQQIQTKMKVSRPGIETTRESRDWVKGD